MTSFRTFPFIRLDAFNIACIYASLRTRNWFHSKPERWSKNLFLDAEQCDSTALPACSPSLPLCAHLNFCQGRKHCVSTLVPISLPLEVEPDWLWFPVSRFLKILFHCVTISIQNTLPCLPPTSQHPQRLETFLYGYVKAVNAGGGSGLVHPELAQNNFCSILWVFVKVSLPSLPDSSYSKKTRIFFSFFSLPGLSRLKFKCSRVFCFQNGQAHKMPQQFVIWSTWAFLQRKETLWF